MHLILYNILYTLSAPKFRVILYFTASPRLATFLLNFLCDKILYHSAENVSLNIPEMWKNFCSKENVSLNIPEMWKNFCSKENVSLNIPEMWINFCSKENVSLNIPEMWINFCTQRKMSG